MEFWESSFRDKHEMWGWTPADSTMTTLELFRKNKLKNILVPGFGYGRNAKVFADNGFKVTGIEISKTAIDLGRKYYGENITVYHGSVSSMPFDNKLYDGIYCYSLLHLLDIKDRTKLIEDCYAQLAPGGYMVFVTIAKTDGRYGKGEEISKDTFLTSHGISLFFYDRGSIQEDFGRYGLLEAQEVDEPLNKVEGQPSQRFWQIICKKES